MSTDVETELYNASIDDKTYLHVQIDFCCEYIAMSKEKDEHNNLGRRRAIAKSYFMLGHIEEGERPARNCNQPREARLAIVA